MRAQTDGTPRRGPRDKRGVIAQTIADCALELFAEAGYVGTSMRAVAQRAGIDPSTLLYYYRDKRTLLEECLIPPPGFVEAVEAAGASELGQRGEAMAQTMLEFWEEPPTANQLRALILTAVHDKLALSRLQDVMTSRIVPSVIEGLDQNERDLRASLLASQLVGVCYCRYVYQIEPLASMSREAVVQLIAPVLQRYLTGNLADLSINWSAGQ